MFLFLFLKSGVIQTWNQEGRQYLRQFATDEVNVKAELAQLSPSHQHRHDAPLRSVTAQLNPIDDDEIMY